MFLLSDMGSFVPLSPTGGTSFGSCSAMTRDNVRELFQSLQVNPLFIMNLLGRPDYWAPQTEWHTDDDGNFLACGLLIPQTEAMSPADIFQTSSVSIRVGTCPFKVHQYQFTCATVLLSSSPLILYRTKMESPV
jgi:hypothetical protein